MSSALRGQNRNVIWWGVSSIDGSTLVPITISSSGTAMIENGTSTMPVMTILNGSFPRDENRIPCLGGQSDNNSTVIIPVSVNPVTGAIQVQTT